MLTFRLAFLMSMPPLMWAGNAVVGRLAVTQMAPLQLNALRWALALLLLLPLGWRAFGSAPRRAQLWQRWPHLLLLGLLGVGAYNALQYMALTTSTPMNVTLVAASMPIWTMAVGALLHGERPGTRQWAGAALSIIGVGVVLTRGELAALAAFNFVIGDLLIVVAVIAFSFYSWLLARPPASMQAAQRPDWHWAEFLCIQIAFGLVWAGSGALAEVLLAAPRAPVVWTPWMLGALAFVAICPSIIAYRCWGLGVAGAGPAVTAFFGNLTPLIAAVLSALTLGEWPQAYHAWAFGLIVGGIVLSARSGR